MNTINISNKNCLRTNDLVQCCSSHKYILPTINIYFETWPNIRLVLFSHVPKMISVALKETIFKGPVHAKDVYCLFQQNITLLKKK